MTDAVGTGRRPGRRGRFTRSAVRTGALNAVSTFIRNHAAARFDLTCTAKPYVAHAPRIGERGKFAHR